MRVCVCRFVSVFEWFVLLFLFVENGGCICLLYIWLSMIGVLMLFDLKLIIIFVFMCGINVWLKFGLVVCLVMWIRMFEWWLFGVWLVGLDWFVVFVNLFGSGVILCIYGNWMWIWWLCVLLMCLFGLLMMIVVCILYIVGWLWNGGMIGVFFGIVMKWLWYSFLLSLLCLNSWLICVLRLLMVLCLIDSGMNCMVLFR